MVRVAWASVALLIVLGMTASVATLQWGDRDIPDALPGAYLVVGWAGVGGSLIVGALGLWARAPATLATALGVLGAGGFAAAWLTELGPNEAQTIVLTFVGLVVAFAASLRRPTTP
jgi:hypothetical protein